MSVAKWGRGGPPPQRPPGRAHLWIAWRGKKRGEFAFNRGELIKRNQNKKKTILGFNGREKGKKETGNHDLPIPVGKKEEGTGP